MVIVDEKFVSLWPLMKVRVHWQSLNRKQKEINLMLRKRKTSNFSLRKVGLFLFSHLSLFFLPPPALAQASEDFYVVTHVVVRVPQSTEQGANPSASGLIEAQRVALKRLLQKMLPPQERIARGAFIKELQRSIKDLLQRSIIVSERRIGRELELSVDIHFNKDKIRKALELAGATYCETSYPSVLLMMQEPLQSSQSATTIYNSFLKAAHVYGFELVQPLRDVEDLANLAIVDNPNKRNEFINWVKVRYKTNMVWQLSAEGFKTADTPENDVSPIIRLNLEEYTGEGSVWHFGKGALPERDSKNVLKTEVLDKAVLKLVEKFINPWINSHFAVAKTSSSFDIGVINSKSLDTLDGLIKNIESMPGIEKVSFLEMSNNNVKLRILYSGEENEIKNQMRPLGAIDNGPGSEMFINLP